MNKRILITDKNGYDIAEGEQFTFKYMTAPPAEYIHLTGCFNYNSNELRYEIDVINDDNYTVLSYISNGQMYDFVKIENKNTPTRAEIFKLIKSEIHKHAEVRIKKIYHKFNLLTECGLLGSGKFFVVKSICDTYGVQLTFQNTFQVDTVSDLITCIQKETKKNEKANN